MSDLPPYVEAKDYICAHALVRGQKHDVIVLGWKGERVYLTWTTGHRASTWAGAGGGRREGDTLRDSERGT